MMHRTQIAVRASAIVALLWAGLGPAQASETRRLGIIVTNNQGLEPDTPLRYADEEGERLRDTLLQVGGFQEQDLIHVSTASPDDVTEAFGQAVLLANEAKTQGQDVSLLVYFTGHASVDGLHLSGQTMSLEALKTAARVVPAQRRIFAIDACQSGALFRSKGSSLVELRSRPLDFVPPEDEAWITSSGPEEQAFEVDRRRGALFTHYFVSGARGGADFNGDNRVTLVELFDFVARQTSSTAAGLGQLQTPRWAGAFEDFVLGDLQQASQGLSFEGPIPYPVLVLDQHTEQVAAEVPSGTGSFLALRPGSYQLVAVGPRQARAGEIQVRPGSVAFVDLGQRLAQVSGVRSKGGMMMTRPYALHVGYHMGLAEVPLRPDAHGGFVFLERALGKGNWLGVRVTVSGSTVAMVDLQGKNQRVGLQAQWSPDLAWRRVRTGPLVRLGGAWLHQELERPADPRWGAWWGQNKGAQVADLGLLDGAVGWRVDLPLGPLWWSSSLALHGQIILSEIPVPSLGATVESGLSVRF